jgi:hypothetical protein
LKKEKRLEEKNRLTIMDKMISGFEGQEIKFKNEFKSSIKVKNMLLKMGWKGQGLGKYEQGIVTPLIVKKTGEKFGIIIDSNTKIEERKINIKNFYNRLPTRVLMITNIIYPDEIDNETYLEIKEEFDTYGFVNDIKFFHFIAGDLPIGESVRVFVEYDRYDNE